MKPEAQQIAIAEACGWSATKWIDGILYGIPPEGYELPPEFYEPDELPPIRVPDYLNDLNAMNQAEQYLNGEEWSVYFNWLQRHGNATGVRATAEQRAKGFLKAKGLWKEDEA